jgi:anionic cell wall polymer biosynthesis LytR-Cps2A-Psr (LCP) family protein
VGDARRRPRAALVLTMATFVGLSAALGQASSVAAKSPITPRTIAQIAMKLGAPVAPFLGALDGANAYTTGTDGRLTMMLLGVDSRGSSLSRTDSIMIVSLKGKSISAASIPRDTSRIPNRFSGGYFPGKVNTILRQLQGAGGGVEDSLSKFELVMEDTLDIEIDYRVVMWFTGFTTLVSEIDPVTVNIEREIADPKHIDDPSGPAGVYFPKWTGYALYGNNTGSNPRCNGAWRSDPRPIDAQNWCHRALPYVRSRKGAGNNDFVRSKRQQYFIAATIKAVSQSEVSGLASTGQNQGMGKWLTNFPVSTSSALDLYNALNGASLDHAVVFKPKTYSGRVAGTSQYAINLAAVRQWTAQYMS